MLKQYAAPGIRSAEDKRKLAEAWLDLAADFVKVTVKFQAEEQEKWQKQQEEQESKPELAMTM